MKRTSIYYFSLAAILAGSLASCQEDNNGYTSEEIARAKFEKEYQANFERDYGKIAPGHTWGFSKSSSKTRAELTGSAQYKITRQEETIDGVKYYVKAEHQKGTRNLEDEQFIRENAPDPVTVAEQTYVFKYLNDHPNEGATKCDLSNYFAQNLGRNPHKYTLSTTTGSGTREEWNDHFNYLYFDEVHLHDYNSPQLQILQGDGKPTIPDYYITNTEIKNPSYQESFNSIPYVTDHYRFYYIPANPRENFPGGVYLCFDYYTKGNNGNYDGDGVYDDWVIKIAPGRGEENFKTYRVFCEDLGSTYDLDFNDLVFDYVDFGGEISINVLALEGTLPISIDGRPMKVDATGKEDLTPHHSVTKDVFYVSRTGDQDIDITEVDIVVSTSDKGNCFIANTEGKAPYLLRVDPDVEWPTENQRIEKKYPDFTKYVSAPTEQPTWWGNFNNYLDITPGN